jgi:hypothetical protein
MRRLLPLPLAVLLFAACYNPIVVSPTSLDLPVGATAAISVDRLGPVGYGPPIATTISFYGNGSVLATGVLEANQHSALVTVTAIRPGVGYVYGPGVNPVAIVNVFACTEAPELTPKFAAIEGKAGEQVFLRVATSMEGGSFQWYTGGLADTSHPIPYSNAAYYIDFTPRANGSYPFWVRQTTPCGVADASFVVNVGPQHRRSVGR